MGQNQKAENSGLVMGLFCMFFSSLIMSIYTDLASPIWLVAARRRMIGAAIVAAFSSLSFVIGYARHSHSWVLRQGWWIPLRRFVEIISLTVVYATTFFFIVLAALTVVAYVFGSQFSQYLIWLVGGFAAVGAYITYVQANQLSAKTVASLLPFFVISGVTTAGSMSDDHDWWRNNFSQLGDRTTFAASLFNYTIVMAGICIIIISYFSVSEMITYYRLTINNNRKPIKHFIRRMLLLFLLLLLSALCFLGVGLFRYTPHPVLHNICARGIALPLTLLMVLLPWLAPQLSRAMYLVSDLIIVIIAARGISWVLGYTSLTNVEALAVFLFMAWFIIFSRQIGAMETDRVQQEELSLLVPASEQPARTESRINPEI
ncbi:hypothetical protein [Scardovia inopinata]|nr:hypothetical protein [Scardovia inopinata]BAR06618.1 conserved hypothetical protein [Scardovia inopinata JCM 12537]